MDINLVINAIKAIVPTTASLAIQQIQSNEYIIKNLQKLGLANIQPGSEFKYIYARALVEYDPESTLEFIRLKKIKEAFWKAFVSSNNEEWNILKAQAENENIDFARVEKFREVFISVANRSINPQQIIASAQIEEQLKILTEARTKEQLKKFPEQLPYPNDFKALIEEKTKAFCGRVFVFNEFDDFLEKHHKGYFTVIGDAGMGKSAIAAQSVLKYKAICYFNIRAEGRNTPDQFLQSIRHQLISRYQLQNAENDNLPTLLTKVNQKLATGEPLIIVVDALDEVEQPGSGNLLDLPKNLPDRIYFLLTRRRYAQNEKRLLTEEVPEQQLDLTANQYEISNQKDIKEYISTFINDEPEHCGLKAWIQKRNIQPPYFIEQVAQKSENNFMYLYYVLPSIARGDYQDLSLEELPEKLQGYYEQHWQQMEMNTPDKRTNAIILCVIIEVGKPISCESIARITEQDEYEVCELLNRWLQFLRKQEQNQKDYYSIYHQSFADFLRNQPILKREKKNNNIDWQEVQRLISDSNDKLWASLKPGEEKNE